MTDNPTATLAAWYDENFADHYADVPPESRALRDAARTEMGEAGDELAPLHDFIDAYRDGMTAQHKSGGELEAVAAFIEWLFDADIWSAR